MAKKKATKKVKATNKKKVATKAKAAKKVTKKVTKKKAVKKVEAPVDTTAQDEADAAALDIQGEESEEYLGEESLDDDDLDGI